MTTVEKDKIVYLDILTKCGEDIIDQFSEDNVFSYIHGHGNLIQRLEDFLDLKDVGFSGIVDVEAKDAFGEYHDDLIITVSRETLSRDVEIQVGSQVETEGPEGFIHLYIKDFSDDTVTLDANHPLAGKDLSFSVRVVDVRKAHEDEIKHGRPHPAGHNIMMEDSSWVENQG